MYTRDAFTNILINITCVILDQLNPQQLPSTHCLYVELSFRNFPCICVDEMGTCRRPEQLPVIAFDFSGDKTRLLSEYLYLKVVFTCLRRLKLGEDAGLQELTFTPDGDFKSSFSESNKKILSGGNSLHEDVYIKIWFMSKLLRWLSNLKKRS